MEGKAPRPLKRISAFLWDVAALQGAWQGLLFALLFALALGGEASAGLWGTATSLWPLAFLAYFALFTWKDGATPGKRLVGVRVERRGGGRPSLFSLLLREGVKLLSLGLLGLPLLLVLLRRDGQGLHDLLAGTQVREG